MQCDKEQKYTDGRSEMGEKFKYWATKQEILSLTPESINYLRSNDQGEACGPKTAHLS